MAAVVLVLSVAMATPAAGLGHASGKVGADVGRRRRDLELGPQLVVCVIEGMMAVPEEAWVRTRRQAALTLVPVPRRRSGPTDRADVNLLPSVVVVVVVVVVVGMVVVVVNVFVVHGVVVAVASKTDGSELVLPVPFVLSHPAHLPRQP